MQNNPFSLEALSTTVDVVMRHAATDHLPPVCIAVSDTHGELVLLRRLPGAPGRTVGIATAKAYTAARMGIPTSAFKMRLINEQQSLQDFVDPGYTALPGGMPIMSGDHIAGAVGISGRSPEQDEVLARAFLSALGKA